MRTARLQQQSTRAGAYDPWAPGPIEDTYPPIGGTWSREQTIRLVLDKARQHDLIPWEFLGLIIAEGLDVYASRPVRQSQWRQFWTILDVSFGLGQINTRYTAEYEVWCKANGVNYHSRAADAYPGDDVIAMLRDAYFNPFHALDVAAERYRYWRYNPDVPFLTAASAYNGPIYYHNPEANPNYGHYRESGAEAREILGMATPDIDRIYAPDVPDIIIHQQNQWSCAVRSCYAMLYMAAHHGLIEPVTYGDDGPRDVYSLLVPRYDDPSVGLHLHTGAGIVQALAEWGIPARNQYPASLFFVQEKAGRVAAMIGGRAWNHWVALRGMEPDGTLILENPLPGWGGIHDQLRDSFAKLGDVNGMMSVVWLDL